MNERRTGVVALAWCCGALAVVSVWAIMDGNAQPSACLCHRPCRAFPKKVTIHAGIDSIIYDTDCATFSNAFCHRAPDGCGTSAHFGLANFTSGGGTYGASGNPVTFRVDVTGVMTGRLSTIVSTNAMTFVATGGTCGTFLAPATTNIFVVDCIGKKLWCYWSGYADYFDGAGCDGSDWAVIPLGQAMQGGSTTRCHWGQYEDWVSGTCPAGCPGGRGTLYSSATLTWN